jgi:hypothetical protein
MNRWSCCRVFFHREGSAAFQAASRPASRLDTAEMERSTRLMLGIKLRAYKSLDNTLGRHGNCCATRRSVTIVVETTAERWLSG